MSNDEYKEWLNRQLREKSIICYPESDLKLDPTHIGHGGFGVVHKAIIKKSGTVVARKTSSPGQYGDDGEYFKHLVKELRMHLKVGVHPNIIRFVGLCKDSRKNYHVIFEYADGGNLREYLKEHFNHLSWRDKQKLGLDISHGLKHLHGLQIIHKDLSSSNVLVRENVAKISDFDLSSDIQKKIMSASHGKGHTAYIDPLSFNGTLDRRGPESDIFSLGVLLWEVSSGKIPCEGRTLIHEVIMYRLHGSRDPPFEGTPEQYVELYSECWSEDPKKRPSAEDVYRRLQSMSG